MHESVHLSLRQNSGHCAYLDQGLYKVRAQHLVQSDVVCHQQPITISE